MTRRILGGAWLAFCCACVAFCAVAAGMMGAQHGTWHIALPLLVGCSGAIVRLLLGGRS